MLNGGVSKVEDIPSTIIKLLPPALMETDIWCQPEDDVIDVVLFSISISSSSISFGIEISFSFTSYVKSISVPEICTPIRSYFGPTK